MNAKQKREEINKLLIENNCSNLTPNYDYFLLIEKLLKDLKSQENVGGLLNEFFQTRSYPQIIPGKCVGETAIKIIK